MKARSAAFDCGAEPRIAHAVCSCPRRPQRSQARLESQPNFVPARSRVNLLSDTEGGGGGDGKRGSAARALPRCAVVKRTALGIDREGRPARARGGVASVA